MMGLAIIFLINASGLIQSPLYLLQALFLRSYLTHDPLQQLTFLSNKSNGQIVPSPSQTIVCLMFQLI